MKLPDGTELLARLAYPIPVTVAGELMVGIGRAAERLGYTDVVLLYNGPHAGSIAATPPVETPARVPGRRRQCSGCGRSGGELTENGCPACGPEAEIQ